MREIGVIGDETGAARLVDHLRALDIEAEARPGRAGWGVWVHREDRMEQASRELAEYLADPESERYRVSARLAKERRREEERAEAKHRKNTIALGGRLNVISPERCPVVHSLILLSILLGAVTWLGGNREAVDRLALSPGRDVVELVPVERDDGRPSVEMAVSWRSEGLSAVRRGQIWRLWTPMFVHGSPMHLIFNMISLYWIGGMLELRQGWKMVLALVLAASPVSFLGEYVWQVYGLGVKNPGYVIGMSGVIFALFGYAWMKSDYEPESDIRITSNQILWMLGWLGLCMTGAVGRIANGAHVVGLVFGMVVALAPHLWSSVRWR